MKKFLAYILVFTLVLGMGAFAFATPPAPGQQDMQSIEIDKVFKLRNQDSISPAEIFSFTIAKVGVEDSQYDLGDMPMFNPATFDIAFAEGEATVLGDTKSASLTLPSYNHVGVFTYKITESPKDTAGVNYDGRDLFLKVYVVNNPAGGFIRYATLYEVDEEEVIGKVLGFENEFLAGDLEIKKLVTGNMGEKDRIFNVVLTLTAPAGKDMTKVPITVNSVENYYDFTGGSETLELEFSEEDPITINNLPYGVSWSVEEEDLTGEGYNAAVYSDDDGTIEGASKEVTITNHKNQDIPTGINLDNLPYILILVGAAAGLVAFTLKRRVSDEK